MGVGNGTVRYGHICKNWVWRVCNFKRDKYDCRRVINRANAKSGIRFNENNEKLQMRMNIGNGNDKAIQMEVGYMGGYVETKSAN